MLSLSFSQPHLPELLAEQAQINGTRGTYVIRDYVKPRGLGRLYQGWQQPDGQPVVLREYLLPQGFFNQAETLQRKKAFSGLAGLSLADGRVQDMRLILPYDAIADLNQERCYLVTLGELELLPSLNDHLKTEGRFNGQQVRHVLNQVLQTLEFLHGQKFSLPNGRTLNHIAHGNLSLDTLLVRSLDAPDIAPDAETIPDEWVSWFQPERLRDSQFLVYCCDLALWERLFDPPTAQFYDPTVAMDLAALGAIAIALLTGQPVTDTAIATDALWEGVSPHLRTYVQQLAGHLPTPFPTADAARRALLALPPEPIAVAPVLLPTLERDDPRPTRRVPWRSLLWVLLALLLGAGLLWLVLKLWQRDTSAASDPQCCIADVASVPTGAFTYTAEQDGTWHTVRQEGLVEAQKTLDQVLQDRLGQSSPSVPSPSAPQRYSPPTFQLTYLPQPSPEQALEHVRQHRAAFWMSSLTEPLPIDLASETVAYDGIAVVVAFSYARRQNSLPRSLHGQIRIDELRRLYTGEIQNWNQLGGPDLPVQLYMPTNPDAVRIFEARVLQTPEAIAQFRQLQQSNASRIQALPTFTALRQIIYDFENDRQQVGAISFAPLSQVFGQCSVYPLAIANSGDRAVQPLVQDNGQPITPTTNLCDAKGSYERNVAVFQSGHYPLAFPVSVVYPRDNRLPPVGRKMAEILRTDESQRLLKAAGLVPLHPLDDSTTKDSTFGY